MVLDFQYLILCLDEERAVTLELVAPLSVGLLEVFRAVVVELEVEVWV
jgi:hypothetical protein